MPVQFFSADGTPLTPPIATLTGLNLLGHAQLEELNIGSKCGGHGKCGADRVCVTEGTGHLSAPSEPEIRLLGHEAISGGVRLACQTFPNNEDATIKLTCLVVGN
jgi:ferredoxin